MRHVKTGIIILNALCAIGGAICVAFDLKTRFYKKPEVVNSTYKVYNETTKKWEEVK